jgi:hypothetical protein
MLDMQMQGVDTVMAKHLPHLLNHSLRVRQLLSLDKLDLTMQLGATEIHLPASLTNVTHTLKAIAPQYVTATQPVKDIYLLHKIGITKIEQLLSPNRTHVLPSSHLRTLTGSHNIKVKHHRAWDRLACIVATGKSDPNKDWKPPTKPIPIDPQVLQTLTTRWPQNPTSKPQTALEMLSNYSAQAHKPALAMRDSMEAHRQTMPEQKTPACCQHPP